MVQFKPFEVERWMDTYETTAQYDLAETCALSIPLKDLLQWSQEEDGEPPLHKCDVFTKKAGYGHIPGSPGLRANIAACYQCSTASSSKAVSADNVLVTQGAIGANFLSILGIVQQGDHVVVVSPSYQQLQELPASFGANVSVWQLRAEEQWEHRVEALEALLTDRTRLIIINNPNNPTGSVISPSTLRAIHAAVKAKAASDAMILCDEVYSPLWHSIPEGGEMPQSILQLENVDLENVLVTGSMSKAYALAGLRVGWVVSHNKNLLQKLLSIRDYNVISVSGVDDELARRALNPGTQKKLMARNMQLARTNRATLSAWIDKCQQSASSKLKSVRWVPTKAGNTALVYLGDGIDDVDFCTKLVTQQGVNMVPAGLCFGQKGWVRIGYVGETGVLREGLEITAAFLEQYNS